MLQQIVCVYKNTADSSPYTIDIPLDTGSDGTASISNPVDMVRQLISHLGQAQQQCNQYLTHMLTQIPDEPFSTGQKQCGSMHGDDSDDYQESDTNEDQVDQYTDDPIPTSVTKKQKSM
ncbi:hypothetical protein BATDEDRAFT_25015 [Batrachochytrium dendrobatidis JAM81]|uniref:Uncharacterized protein n=1 Tax=Batrachochytrium dendrobatidis (strain JAM81 / FGSC 10211) TaxID=684364 RepID=F4P3F8_BATDJ|nr:uncharacterized protein BATDEDRAFT_25015 [Batrachochytrium dendrobatidis JAM81]EGF80437.1 hypothetical protein BATDEDRAFT_25015 [Batrachochytrium dendrobatidis JAM81]|eukprot:XP_006678989.1 hypothetical protein BATDEDRAFT_25015 [Batrachochytrium dendrobatidis JAM81]